MVAAPIAMYVVQTSPRRRGRHGTPLGVLGAVSLRCLFAQPFRRGSASWRNLYMGPLVFEPPAFFELAFSFTHSSHASVSALSRLRGAVAGAG